MEWNGTSIIVRRETENTKWLKEGTCAGGKREAVSNVK
jgi:hypothetical protein